MSDRVSETTTESPEWSVLPARDGDELGLLQLYPLDATGPYRTWTLNKAAVVGRGSGCDIQIDDPAVSRQHARLEVLGARMRVCDTGSRSGSFIDAHRVEGAAEAPLGSVLRVGQTLLMPVRDVGRYRRGLRRLASDFLGLAHDVFAGPATWVDWQAAMEAATFEYPVLVTGESGTGKEIIARLLHLSRPQPSPWVALNLAAVPDGLFEAELFGSTRGAFTGATRSRLGAFREANGGTLFLDEIGELRPELQVKLLRVLESRRVRPLGATGDLVVRTRVVAATSRDLAAAVRAGTFRDDLFYRLSGLVIHTKPLRERRDEILPIAQAIIERGAPGASLSVAAAEKLLLRTWRGNLRELHHVAMRGALAMKATGAQRLQAEQLSSASEDSSTGSHPLELNRRPSASNTRIASAVNRIPLTLESVHHALVNASGNMRRAAVSLGTCRATLYNFCARNQIDLVALRSGLEPSDAGSDG